eukprot:s2982_g5.t1
MVPIADRARPRPQGKKERGHGASDAAGNWNIRAHEALVLIYVSWLMPYLLLPDSRYSVNSGIVLLSLSGILIAAVSVQFLVALLSEVQKEQHSKSLRQESLEVEWSAYIEDLLDKAIAMSDGTDGNKWRFEGREQSTEIYSQDVLVPMLFLHFTVDIC